MPPAVSLRLVDFAVTLHVPETAAVPMGTGAGAPLSVTVAITLVVVSALVVFVDVTVANG
jgi:hypothetical protein